MASLTEAAKAVLEGKTLQEGAYPEVSPGKISNPNPVDPSTASTANAKTLRPSSKAVEGRHPNPGAPDPTGHAEDLGGATPTSTAKENLGAKASGGKKRDTSVKGSGSNTEPTKKLAAEEMEQDGEVVEETTTMSLAERLKALKEARKSKKDDEDENEKEDKKEDKHEGKMEKCDEELELSEELEDFIAEAIEAGLNEEEILAAIDENFEFVSEETESEEIAEELENYEVDMTEHVNALLEGENLSEEFHAKATTIFEAAVKAKLEEEVALLEQAYAETLEERVNEIMEELASNVDDYLNYVVEQWIEENEVAVESALRSELTEDFISGLRALFAEHYIDVPEDSVDVVEELSATVEELEAKLNEEIQRSVELSGIIAEARKTELIYSVCEGLTDVQADKLAGLLENVAYTSDEEFVEKIETLKENYFPTAVKNDSVLDSVETNDPQSLTESIEGPMGRYVQALGRTLPR
jgi:hypothetical protein